MSDPGLDPELQLRLRVCVRRVCPAWLAGHEDDLVQTALMKLVRSKVEIRTDWAYLNRLAYSVVVDEIRRRQRRHEVGMSPSMPDRIANSADLSPEDRTRGLQVGEAVVDCLGELRSLRRRAVVLHLQDHPIAEIATMLRVDPKKAANLTYRGMADLRQALRKRGLKP